MMIGDDLEMRLRRIYAAIDASQETDLTTVVPEVIVTKDFICMTQDFRGGFSDEQMHNIAHQMIHSIANLRDNLEKWAERNGKQPMKVMDKFRSSLPIRIIQDLSNNDKHGYPPRNGSGNSGNAPVLTDIHRAMIFAPKPGHGLMVVFEPTGPRQVGEGSAKVIVTGQIVDKDAQVIGELHSICMDALTEWENLLVEYGVPIQNERGAS